LRASFMSSSIFLIGSVKLLPGEAALSRDNPTLVPLPGEIALSANDPLAVSMTVPEFQVSVALITTSRSVGRKAGSTVVTLPPLRWPIRPNYL
jgi:hypothetical protein